MERRALLRDALSENDLGARLLSPSDAELRMKDTCFYKHATPLVLPVRNSNEIRQVLALVRAIGATVHPVSSGRNWGYGTARAGRDQADLVLDLSAMNSILDYDSDLGLVRVEPGVTQGQLAAFLKTQGNRHMVPTSGAGPECSLAGNALERGYGMTPISDHFQAVLGLSAITASGRVYRSALQHDDSSSPYRWGVGAYLDGIFSQSGGAIITEMTLQLKPLPDRVEMFVFWIKEARELGQTVEAVRHLITTSGLEIGGINLMNAERIEAMAGASATRGCAWVGTGVMFGDRRVTTAGRHVIRRALNGPGKTMKIVNADRLRLARRIMSARGFSVLIPHSLRTMLRSVGAAHDVLSGQPNAFALQLAYAQSQTRFPEDATRANPAMDGCGLLWYAPIVPIQAKSAEEYVALVTRVCTRYGFAPPITFSTLSSSAFDSTVPLLFPNDAENSCRAMDCLRALIAEGRKLGFEPYRFHADLMDEATASAPDHWWLVAALRDTLDPERTISPGRYMPNPSSSDLNTE